MVFQWEKEVNEGFKSIGLKKIIEKEKSKFFFYTLYIFYKNSIKKFSKIVY